MTVTHLLNEIKRLMELKGENVFKVRAYEKAAHVLEGRTDLEERAKNETLTELPGIGKGIATLISEYVLTGRSSVMEELQKSLPKGLLELTTIPGLGPKKALHLIEELGIESIAELEYACRENRLLNLKGFGSKNQQKILDGIVFRNANQGYQRLSEVIPIAHEFFQGLQSVCPSIRISETGGLRRKLEVLNEMEWIIEEDSSGNVRSQVENFLSLFVKKQGAILPIRIHYVNSKNFGFELARTTSTKEHWQKLGNPEEFPAESEEEFYKNLGLPWISPELRETGEEVSLARSGALAYLLPWKGVRGVFHNHTTRSDGSASLEEMVIAAEKLGFEYIGISDHSQSAFYAQGLKEADLIEQEKEIQIVQKKHPNIRIFWGVESDILADGSLDYPPHLLKKFDFVIASIHSRLNMNKTEMTERILNAIRNPYTRFLGHPTGRLLLGRKESELDMEAIIAEAAKRGVAVEMNANPARLDLDWRWGKVMRDHKTYTSINPDAHETEGLKNVEFGVMIARKALLPTDQVVNAKSVNEVEKWLRRPL